MKTTTKPMENHMKNLNSFKARQELMTLIDTICLLERMTERPDEPHRAFLKLEWALHYKELEDVYGMHTCMYMGMAEDIIADAEKHPELYKRKTDVCMEKDEYVDEWDIK